MRSLAATPDGWIYADIHVGGIVRSHDGGTTWRCLSGLHEDVHQVATTPAAPDRVAANTAVGVYVSDDRGETWDHRAADLDNRYGRAVAISPRDPDVMLATVSDGPHGEDVHGQLYRTGDAGRSWQHVTGGVPASVPENINTFQTAFAKGKAAWLALGRALYRSSDDGVSWRVAWEAPDTIRMVLC